MKVVFTIAGLDARFGGTSRSVPRLGEALVNQGVEVELITLVERRSGDAKTGVVSSGFGITCVETSTSRYAPFGWTSRFKKFVARALDGPSPVLLHDIGVWLPTNHFAAGIARQRQVPLAVSPRGMLSPWALQSGRWKKKLAWWIYQKRDLQSARLLHATAEREAAQFRALGFHQQISVIPNGVDIPQVCDSRSLSRDPRRILLFLSRIHPVKGLPDLIRAWACICPESWRLVIAGPDENGHRADVERLVSELNLQDSVQFIGPVKDAAKRDLYAAANLFVLPSYSENFGMVVAEALASGIPVITTRATPWRELEKYRCGWWVDPGQESIAAALREATQLTDEQHQEMGRRGRKLVEQNYSWDRVGCEMKSVYEWVLGTGPRPQCIV